MCGKLLFFILGAGAATWWSKHRDLHHAFGPECYAKLHGPQSQPQPSIQAQKPGGPASGSQEKQSPDGPDQTASGPAGWGWGWGGNPNANSTAGWPSAPWHQADAQGFGFGGPSQVQVEQWAEQKRKFAEVSRQVGDTVTDFSEATLDTLSKSIDALKARMAQHRLERQRFEEQSHLAQNQAPTQAQMALDEQRRTPSPGPSSPQRWV